MAVVELGMNHAGEISTLVRIAEPDVRVWTNVGEAHLGFFASLDAIADAKAEILEGAGAVDAARRQRRRRADRRAHRRVPGRVVTFGIDARRRRPRQRASSIAASTARRARVDDAARRRRARDAAARPRQPRERARRDRGGDRVRRAARRDRRRAPRRCGRRRTAARSSGCAGGVTRDRRQLQREPDGDQEGARRARGAPPRRGAIAVLGEMLELGEHVGRAARGRRPRGGRAPASTCCSRSAARRRRRWPTRRSRPGCRRRSVHYFATSDEAADAAARARPAGRSRAGQGIARHHAPIASSIG